MLTGIARYDTLNNAAPVANALKVLGFNGIRQWVSIGAIVGMLSSLLVFQYGQARIWFAMSRDGLLPKMFAKVHPVHKTPHISTWIAGLVVGIPAGIWDIGTFADLANIGTLFAFIIVSLGVIVLRKTQPDRPRGFRVPGVAVAADDLDRLLPGADDGVTAGDVGTLFRLAADRFRDLLPVRPQA